MNAKEKAYKILEKLVERFDDPFDEYKKGFYNETQTRVDYINPSLKHLDGILTMKQALPKHTGKSFTKIKSKHTLLIDDACFGGAIFKTRTAFPDARKAIQKLYELTSRKAMTSGTLTEVPDLSAFINFLVERLENNTEKYLSSDQLFSSFRIAVINNSNAIPQYGEIRNVGDQVGDFIFIKK